MPGLAVDTVECFGRTDPQDSLTILVYCANKGFSAYPPNLRDEEFS